MEEIEKKNGQNERQGQEGAKSHGRRRRHKRGHGHGNGGNGAQPQDAQSGQNATVVKKEQNGNGQKPQPQKPLNKGQQPKKDKQPQKQQPSQPAQQNQNQPAKNKQKSKAEKRNEPQRKDTYVYLLDGNIYLNLTNKCSNGCDFCVRNERTSYYGNYLWLQKGEPTAAQVIAQINGLGDLTRYKEAVFCGFGEPTYRMEVLVEVAEYLHEKGIATRLNTNGQGNLINKRDIIPDLVGRIDLVNVSLNASCYEKYQKICRSMFREAGFDGMVEFAKNCKRQGVNVRFSIVDCIGEEEVEACKRLAASVNVPLYIRDYITDS